MAEPEKAEKPTPALPEAAPAPKEMRPGGEFIVNGVRVDANGAPIKDDPPAPAAASDATGGESEPAGSTDGTGLLTAPPRHGEKRR